MHRHKLVCDLRGAAAAEYVVLLLCVSIACVAVWNEVSDAGVGRSADARACVEHMGAGAELSAGCAGMAGGSSIGDGVSADFAAEDEPPSDVQLALRSGSTERAWPWKKAASRGRSRLSAPARTAGSIPCPLPTPPQTARMRPATTGPVSNAPDGAG